ncbi:MAG: tetraacyldisaccharide 4'-kinase [Betaproteobacteria bacterium]|nr:MAG: tetraacyldisaccharide 4'-kinase [Betaproteobacteria bacterium]
MPVAVRHPVKLPVCIGSVLDVHLLEKHWQRITLVTIALLPLSVLFAVLSWLRRTAYASGLLRRVRLPLPVVVVGNLSVGGTGKTPVVVWLVDALRRRGFRPGVVSRGYRGAEEVTAVAADTSPEIGGDEAVLIARRAQCPVWVGRDRSAAALQLIAANPDVNVIVSDDGLQHYRLQRDCELVVINARQRFGNRLLLPAGPLREPVSRLRTVDAVIVNGASMPDLPNETFDMRLEGDAFCNLVDPARTASPSDFEGLRLHAVAGIGDPERFFSHLRRLGLSFTAHPFPDHHAFRLQDLDFSDADAVLMTQKDAIKCARFACKNWWALPVEARIDDALTDLVIRKIGSDIGH